MSILESRRRKRFALICPATRYTNSATAFALWDAESRNCKGTSAVTNNAAMTADATIPPAPTRQRSCWQGTHIIRKPYRKVG
jgi:hypothetical protein